MYHTIIWYIIIYHMIIFILISFLHLHNYMYNHNHSTELYCKKTFMKAIWIKPPTEVNHKYNIWRRYEDGGQKWLGKEGAEDHRTNEHENDQQLSPRLWQMTVTVMHRKDFSTEYPSSNVPEVLILQQTREGRFPLSLWAGFWPWRLVQSGNRGRTTLIGRSAAGLWCEFKESVGK